MNDRYAFDWSDLAFGSKKPLRDLKAIFIAAPRELSGKRFTQLVKAYLPQGNIVLGIAKEPYVDGFEGQPQFKTLQSKTVQQVIDKVNEAGTAHHIYTLEYFQRELPYVLEKSRFQRVVLINGSWQHVFHVSPAYYYLAGSRTPYDMVSPFVNEAEARAYEASADAQIAAELPGLELLNARDFSETDMLAIANLTAKHSYDYSFQTGVALGKPMPGKTGRYELLASTFNKVVPFQTYAMHYGSLREKHFSPPHDLNHYDTNHAEIMLLITAQQQHLSLAGTTVFINLLPCPSCARMFASTDISEFVYIIDHSNGYAIKMLEAVGKTVRRVV